jgi:hypothetical protein
VASALSATDVGGGGDPGAAAILQRSVWRGYRPFGDVGADATEAGGGVVAAGCVAEAGADGTVPGA